MRKTVAHSCRAVNGYHVTICEIVLASIESIDAFAILFEKNAICVSSDYERSLHLEGGAYLACKYVLNGRTLFAWLVRFVRFVRSS